MKKFNFFSNRFLDEVQTERAELMRQIQMPEFALTPVDFSHEEKQVAMLYANRLTWLLYQGGRISEKEFINDCYVLSHHTESFTAEKKDKRFNNVPFPFEAELNEFEDDSY